MTLCKKVCKLYLAGFFGLCGLCACTLSPNPVVSPELVLPETRYLDMKLPGEGDVPISDQQQYVAGAAMSPQWWKSFSSVALNQLIDTALKNSPSVLSAQEKLVEAGHYLNALQGEATYPQVDLDLSAKRQQVNTASLGLSQLPNPKPFTLYNSTLNIQYNLDLFGAQKHLIASKKYEVDVRQHQAQGIRLALISNIITAAIHEGDLRAQIEIKNALLTHKKIICSMLEGRYQQGGLALTEVLESRNEVDKAAAELPPLEKSLSQVRHQLAVYTGEFDVASLPQFELSDFTLPSGLPLSLPSELLHRHPDIQAAESQLNVVSELAGVAHANLYPQINLGASVGSVPLELSKLFTSQSSIWNLGAGLVAPVFHGGELQAKEEASKAAFQAASQEYKKVVLQTFQNVADTMSALEQEARALEILNAATERYKTLMDMTDNQLRFGNKNGFDFLAAKQAYDLARLNESRSHANQLLNSATFFFAIGGPVSNP